MSTASKWLLAAVVLLNLATAYLGLQVLSQYRQVRGQVNSLESQITQETARTKQLAVGTPDAPGIAELRNQLHAVVSRRGRAWYNVAPTVQVDQQSGGIVVQVQLAEPFVPSAENETKGVLFAFEQDGPIGQQAAPEGEALEPAAEDAPPAGAPRRYVGEFRIVAAQGNTLTLIPALFLTQAEGEALLASQGPWTLYDVLPLDSHAALAGLDEAAVRDVFRVDQREGASRGVYEGIAKTFLHDGQAAAADDPPELVEGEGEARVYRRPLIDFGFLLRELDRQRTLLFDRIAATQAEKRYLTQSKEDSVKQEAFHQQQMADLRKRQQELAREMAAVNTVRSAIEKELQESRAEVDRLLAENRVLASEIAAAEFSAVRQATERPYDEDAPAGTP